MPPNLTWPAGLVLALVLLAGLLLVLAGRRGRLVNDHPICRACRFDLIGLEPGARCPECGADLAPPRAVIAGRRRRRPVVLAAGMLLVLVPSGAFGLQLYQAARVYDWNRAKPVWWLLRDLRAAGAGPVIAPSPEQPYLEELIRRARHDGLREGHYAELMAVARARQADAARPWDPRWGHLVELGFEHGKIGETPFDRYLEGIIVGRFEVRARVRAGRPLPARLSIEARAGPLAGLGFTGERASLIVAGRDRQDIGGRLLHTGPAGGERRGWRGPKYLGERYLPSMNIVDITAIGRTAAREDGAPILAPSLPGVYTITTTWRFEIQGRAVPTVSRVVAACARRTFERTFTQTFTVVPEGESTVALIAPPGPEAGPGDPGFGMQARLREVFGVRRHDPVALNGLFTTGPAPCGYAFEVFAVVSGREVALGTLVPLADDPFDEGDTRQFMLESAAPLGRVEYILRPSPETAELTVNLDKIWGGEIRLRESEPVPGLLK